MLCGSHTKIWNPSKHQNARSIDERLKSKSLMFFVSFFFTEVARFQILRCEPKSIWRKLLVLSWLYKDFFIIAQRDCRRNLTTMKWSDATTAQNPMTQFDEIISNSTFLIFKKYLCYLMILHEYWRKCLLWNYIKYYCTFRGNCNTCSVAHTIVLGYY